MRVADVVYDVALRLCGEENKWVPRKTMVAAFYQELALRLWGVEVNVCDIGEHSPLFDRYVRKRRR